MKSFDIHFNSKGQVMINNIVVDDPNDCLSLTKDYVDILDGSSNTEMLIPIVEKQSENLTENA